MGPGFGYCRRRRRSIVKPGIERRLTESVEIALTMADEVVLINTLDHGDRLFSRRLACVACGIAVMAFGLAALSLAGLRGGKNHAP